MNRKLVARLPSAALVFAAAALFVAGCGDDTETTTTEQLQQASIVTNNGVFSALVASQYDIAQVATYAKGVPLVDSTLADKVLADANAALVTLYGTAAIDGADGTAAAPGGLASSAGLALESNPATDAINEQATSDLGSVADDLSYAQVAQAETQALLNLIDSYLGAPADGGVDLTNDALRTELTKERDAVQADLNEATTTSCGLDPTQDGCAAE